MSGVGQPGYKETAVGWIPVEWSVEPLGESLSALMDYRGRTPKKLGMDWGGGFIPALSANNVRMGYIDFDRECYLGSDELYQAWMVNGDTEESDLVFTMEAPLGNVALIPDGRKYILSQRVVLLRPNDLVQPAYLFQYLQSDGFVEVLNVNSTGTTAKGIQQKRLVQLPLVRPPLPEQQKIAAILTAVDDKLDLIARQISATQTLKQGLMQTLFTRGAGTPDAQGRWHPHTEFQDTELGRIPVGWRVGHLQDYIAALRSGVSVNAEDRIHGDGEVGVLKVSCVLHGKFYPQGHKTVPPEEVARVAEPVLQGRIIISRANTPALVGESAYVDRAWPDLFLPDKLWQTEASDLPHSVKWLAFYLQSPFVRQEISKAATGTSGSMKNIAKPALLNIAMPLVPVAEQEYVAELLSSVVDKLTTLTTQRTHYQSLKRGLMQKLLTGQWRVRVDAATLAPVNEKALA